MYPQAPYGQPQYQQMQNAYQYNQQQMPYNQPPPNPYNQQPMYPTEVIDWDGVSSIDPELVRRTGDLTQLQPFISRFVSTNLAYESQVLTHPLSVRLCSILQVSLQYMSDVQRQLQQVIEEKDRRISKLQLENRKLKESSAKSDDLIQKLRKPYEKCPICQKKYQNYDYLDLHFERKHPEHMDEWLSIRNKRPAARQNNDIVQMMAKIEALQNTIRKDRDRKGHRSSHHHRDKENDENIKTLRKELYDQQDQLMATEAIQDELSMTQRQDIKGALDTAVDELNSSWIAWNKKSKSKDNKKSKQNQTKITKDENELNNMYNDKQVLVDEVEDELNPDNNFTNNCNSSDLHNQPNVYEEINNPFHFDLYQNNYNPPVESNQQPVKESKKDKKDKKSLFKKNKNNSKNQSNSESNQRPFNIQANQAQQMKPEVNNAQSNQIIRSNVQKPPSKKTLPPEVQDLMSKAKQFVIRKFTPTYDDSMLDHSKHRIEKKLRATNQKFVNENSEAVGQLLQDQSGCDPNDYINMKRKVTFNIDKEAPVKHCTFFDSTLSDTSTLTNSIPKTISEDKINSDNKIIDQTPIKASETSTSNGNSSTKRKRKKSIKNTPSDEPIASERSDPIQRNKKHCQSQGYPIGKVTPKVSAAQFVQNNDEEPEYEYYYVDEEELHEDNKQPQPEIENANQQEFLEEVSDSNDNNIQITSGQISLDFLDSENKENVQTKLSQGSAAKNEQIEFDTSSDIKRTSSQSNHIYDPNDSIDAYYLDHLNNEESHKSSAIQSENLDHNYNEGNHTNEVDGNHTNEVDGNHTNEVDENQAKEVDENQANEVDENQANEIDENQANEVDKNQTNDASDKSDDVESDNASENQSEYSYYTDDEENDNVEVDQLNKTQRSMKSNQSEHNIQESTKEISNEIQQIEMQRISDSETDSYEQQEEPESSSLSLHVANQNNSSLVSTQKSSNSTQNTQSQIENDKESTDSSYTSKQNFNFLASKYGNPPARNLQSTNPPAVPASNRSNRFLQNIVFENTQDASETIEEEEYSESESINQPEKANNISQDLIDDIFIAPSGNVSSIKDKSGTGSKSKLRSMIHKTFASSSAADQNEFSYNRGPPMNQSNYAPDEDFVNYNEQSLNEKESYFKSAGEYESDENGPPVLSRKKDPNSIISNDDFNL